MLRLKDYPTPPPIRTRIYVLMYGKETSIPAGTLNVMGRPTLVFCDPPRDSWLDCTRENMKRERQKKDGRYICDIISILYVTATSCLVLLVFVKPEL